MNKFYQISIDTPIGMMVAKATDDGLFLLDFLDDAQEIDENSNDILQKVKIELNEYFSKKRDSFDIPIFLNGTAFEKEVWHTLLKIEYGKTISYEDEAKMINNPKAYRAVANANGKNPISIIIPCHRVISKNGALGGYTGGVWRKKFLLELEDSF